MNYISEFFRSYKQLHPPPKIF